jgi:hypothetical protein
MRMILVVDFLEAGDVHVGVNLSGRDVHVA